MSPGREVRSPDELGGPTSYTRFVAAVADAQVRNWLAGCSGALLDLSGPASRTPRLLAGWAGTAVRLQDPRHGNWPRSEPTLPTVAAECQHLSAVASDRFDAVVAEDGALSGCLAAEETLAALHRVLRAGGRLLLSADSLTAGLSRLAELGRWAELADSPAADVVIVPGEGGRLSRCFGVEELRVALRGAGFTVDWIRSRTVLAPASVARILDGDPGALPGLVEAELSLAAEYGDEALGARLVASARR